MYPASQDLPPPGLAPAPPEAQCPVHPDAAAVAVCSRCGTFVCLACRRDGPKGDAFCPACAPATLPLADRGTRLAAAMIDGVLSGFAAFGITLSAMSPFQPRSVLFVLVGLSVLAVELYFCATSSQSIGKAALRIRVVRPDGSRASLFRILVLRNGAVQAAGALFRAAPLIDAAFIFREDRRCLHDHLADTVVVKVPPGTP